MDFTDDMIKEVLFALQHPELQEQNAEKDQLDQVVTIEPAEAVEQLADDSPRPKGRHYKVDGASRESQDSPDSTADNNAVLRRLNEVEKMTQDDELHILTRDYIVAVTNQVVRRLERVS